MTTFTTFTGPEASQAKGRVSDKRDASSLAKVVPASVGHHAMLLEEECLPLHLIEQLPEDPSAAAWREEGWEMPAIGGT